MKETNTLVALCSSRANVPIDWSMNFATFWRHAPRETQRAIFQDPCIDIARDRAANMAISLGAKYLFFLDVDVSAPADAIQNLIADDKDIVGGNYSMRLPPFANNNIFRVFGQYARLRHEPDSDLIEVDATGAGCLLIKCSVFEKLERPFFYYSAWRENNGVSEDVFFCEKAKKAGFKIFVDKRVKCMHEGSVKYLPCQDGRPQVDFPLKDMAEVFEEPEASQ